MPYYKVSWFFGSQTDGVGWSENWWVQANDAGSALNLHINYPQVRKALLLDNTAITNVRCANVDKTRDGLLTQVSGATGTIPTATQKQAGVWDCLLMRRDDALHTTIGHMFLHEVPAVIFNGRVYLDNPGTFPAWQTALNAFRTEVTNGQYLIRKKLPGAQPSYVACGFIAGIRRTSRKLGRPLDSLRGRRSVA